MTVQKQNCKAEAENLVYSFKQKKSGTFIPNSIDEHQYACCSITNSFFLYWVVKQCYSNNCHINLLV